MANMSPEGIGAWLDLFDKSRQQGANRPFYGDMAQANRDTAVGNAGITGAKAQFAPQLYESQAQNSQNQAGLSAIDLQYAPQMSQQRLQGGGLSNQLNQLRLQQMRQQMNAQPKFSGSSPFGKLQQDRMEISRMYGEDSPQVAQIDDFIAMQSQGKEGITVYDPNTGDPLINIGGNQGAGSSRSGGKFLNPETGEVYAASTPASKTRDARTIAGAQNVQDYVKTLVDKYPNFLTASQQGKNRLQKEANYFLGTDFEGPSNLVEAEAAALTMAEGFVNTFGLNATNEIVAKAQGIFKPVRGEGKTGWTNRVSRQMLELARVEQRAKGRQGRGERLGIMGDEGSFGVQNNESEQPAKKNTSAVRRYNPKTGKIE